MAQSGRPTVASECLLLGVKRTSNYFRECVFSEASAATSAGHTINVRYWGQSSPDTSECPVMTAGSTGHCNTARRGSLAWR
jgi:hypothetical protein